MLINIEESGDKNRPGGLREVYVGQGDEGVEVGEGTEKRGGNIQRERNKSMTD